MWSPEIESDLQKSAQHFQGAATVVPFYTIGRILMPGGQQPALAVPLDGNYVVAENLNRSPYSWMMNRMESNHANYQSFSEQMKAYEDFSDVRGEDIDGITPYLPNGFFSFADALALTTILATKSPKRYLEIGCGNSTRFARRAISKFELPTKITCIDPSPRRSVQGIADEVIPQSVLDADISLFSELEAGDILMLDGSHLVFHGSDTPHVFMRILPELKEGVLIHVHDIFLPFEYPERCDRLYWNEQYMLGTLFMHKPVTDIIAPIHFMFQKGLCKEGVSFWFSV